MEGMKETINVLVVDITDRQVYYYFLSQGNCHLHKPIENVSFFVMLNHFSIIDKIDEINRIDHHLSIDRHSS